MTTKADRSGVPLSIGSKDLSRMLFDSQMEGVKAARLAIRGMLNQKGEARFLDSQNVLDLLDKVLENIKIEKSKVEAEPS